jgi:hypothetical protein
MSALTFYPNTLTSDRPKWQTTPSLWARLAVDRINSPHHDLRTNWRAYRSALRLAKGAL